jgi:hypothetical protein
MSTTTAMETAFEYSGVADQRGTVLEIEVGRVDVGASLSFLSQYPGEKEYLMQPLACLEVRPPLPASHDSYLSSGFRKEVTLSILFVSRAGQGQAAHRPLRTRGGPSPQPLIPSQVE